MTTTSMRAGLGDGEIEAKNPHNFREMSTQLDSLFSSIFTFNLQPEFKKKKSLLYMKISEG